jgi:hypothetical protein
MTDPVTTIAACRRAKLDRSRKRVSTGGVPIERMTRGKQACLMEPGNIRECLGIKGLN